MQRRNWADMFTTKSGKESGKLQLEVIGFSLQVLGFNSQSFENEAGLLVAQRSTAGSRP